MEETQKILPVAGKRNILITSALPYVNNVPHLGNIIGSVLSADVYARYCRNRGYQTLFVGGTDEYGTATERAAIKEKATPMEICNKYHKIHSEIYKWFDISFDIHGRTTTKQQTEIAQDIFTKCYKNGFVSESSVSQLFCEKCNKFLADRFVEGTCPRCGVEGARGDQCDACQSLFNATELVSPVCQMPECGNTPVVKSSDHLFLDLKKLQPQLEEWVGKSFAEGWDEQSKGITKAWLKKGLESRSISRDLQWGVSVPAVAGEKYANKVFYVWFDAPIGYISITANYTEQWEKWWKNPEQVELYQFMGKDNVPFHSLIFPGTLIATSENWTLVNGINCTSYLNYEGGKFSKSRSTGVFGNDVQELGIPSFVWRFYLLSVRPTGGDSDFTWRDLVAKNNNELLANVGNFANRVLKFVGAEMGGRVPKRGAESSEDEVEVAEWEKQVEVYVQLMEERELKAALQTAVSLSSLGNKFLQRNKPWELVKQGNPRGKTVISISLALVNLLATLLEPFIPSFSANLLKQLNLPLTNLLPGSGKDTRCLPKFLVPEGHQISSHIEPIVTEIPQTRLAELYKRFGALSQTTFKLRLKVGKVASVDPHPQSGGRYILKVDIGEANLRTVVSSLEGHYSPAQLLGRKVVVLANLKNAAIGGVNSEGMLLASKLADNSVLLLEIDQDVPLGSLVGPKGWLLSRPEPQVDIKQWKECIFLTDKDGSAFFQPQEKSDENSTAPNLIPLLAFYGKKTANVVIKKEKADLNGKIF